MEVEFPVERLLIQNEESNAWFLTALARKPSEWA